MPAHGSRRLPWCSSPSRRGQPYCCIPFQSTIAVRLPAPWRGATWTVSQTWPSWASPSPSITNVCDGRPRRRVPIAIPRATENPCPSEPVEASRHGRASMSGWPWRRLSPLSNVSSSSTREVAAHGHHGVQPHGAVALGQDEPVALGPVRLVRPDPQHAEVERHQQVHRRQRAAHVAGAAVRDRLHDKEAPAPGERLEVGVGPAAGRDARSRSLAHQPVGTRARRPSRYSRLTRATSLGSPRQVSCSSTNQPS